MHQRIRAGWEYDLDRILQAMTERLKSLEPCACGGCPACEPIQFREPRQCMAVGEYSHDGYTWCPECLDELKQREFEEQLNGFIDSQAKKEH